MISGKTLTLRRGLLFVLYGQHGQSRASVNHIAAKVPRIFYVYKPAKHGTGRKIKTNKNKRNMKKLFALIVAICATTLAWADDSGSCGENVTYSYVSSTGTLTISGTGAMTNYNSSNRPSWYNYRSSIKKVVINNGVTSIGEEAFYNCTGLPSITIPNSVTSIGIDAFYGCEGLTSVTIPNSVTSIGERAFKYCYGLTSVTIPNSVTSIGDWAFSYCTGLTSITIPNSVTSIGDWAFMECTLTSITIGNGVTSIGDWAFYDCTGLTSMTVEATNPPYCGNGYIVSNYNIPLYVPAGSVDAYKAADEWKKFTNIQAIPATGVNEATAEKREVKKIIDRNGIIYIEKDGTRYFLNGGKAE